MRIGVIVAAAVILAVGAGCTDGSNGATKAVTTTPDTAAAASSTQVATTTTTPDQAPVLPDRIVAEAIPAGEFGTAIDLGGGLSVTIGDPRVEHDDEHPWVEVPVEAVLAASAPGTVAPAVELVCSGLTEGGGNLDGESYRAGAPIAPGGTVKGTAQLVLPGDGGFGDPSQCLDPAYVRVEATDSDGTVVLRRLDVPSSLVAEINELVVARSCEIAPSGCAPPDN